MSPRRGGSLVEVLVTSAVFSMFLLALIGIYLASRGAYRKSDAQTDAYRQALVTVEQLRRELRGSGLDLPAVGEEGTQLSYNVPQERNGLLVVDAGGKPVWAGQAVIRMDGERLVRELGGRRRVLAHLGPGGSIAFRRDSPVLLHARVLAVVPGHGDKLREGRYAIEVDIKLSSWL